MPRALVVGGSAATGPYIVSELLARGFDVSIYHRGVHEVPLPNEIEHIHGDPHFRESIAEDLGERRWDVVVATYGRIRYLADYLCGRTDRLVTVGGWPVLKGWMHIADEHWASRAGPVMVLAPEDHPREDPGVDRFLDRMRDTELAILEHHERSDYLATHLRYPNVYGPNGVLSFEWPVIKRIIDGRRRCILQERGQELFTRCAAPNAAHTVGLVLDAPERSGGKIYHLGDDRQYTRRQWLDLIASAAGHEFEYFDIPYAIAPPGRLPNLASCNGAGSYHRLVDTTAIKVELGYRDVVAPEDWVRHTVAWVLSDPARHGLEQDLGAEYEIEDQAIEVWERALAAVPEIGRAPESVRHPYPHPKEPGRSS